MRVEGRISRQHPLGEGEELYRESVFRDEEDRWKVKLKEVVEPTKVVYRQPSPLRNNNLWLK
jgi:hypothetical protein